MHATSTSNRPNSLYKKVPPKSLLNFLAGTNLALEGESAEFLADSYGLSADQIDRVRVLNELLPKFNYNPFSNSSSIYVRPIRVNYEANSFCNMSCDFCFADFAPGPQMNELKSNAGLANSVLDTVEVIALCYQIASLGSSQTLFGGGDPFIRPDMPGIIAYSKSLGQDVTVETNGFILGNPNKRSLYDTIKDDIWQLGLALDGSNSKTHDSFRNKKGSFDRVLTVINYSRESDHRLKINTVVSKQNIHTLVDMVETLAPYHTVIDWWSLEQFAPLSRGKHHQEKHSVDSAQYGDVINKIKDRSKELSLSLHNKIGGGITEEKQYSVFMFGPQGVPYTANTGGKIYFGKNIREQSIHLSLNQFPSSLRNINDRFAGLR